MKEKIQKILEILEIDSILRKEVESPQLVTYFFDLKDSRAISKVNQKNLEIISDYLKKKVDLSKGGEYSFSLTIPKDLPDGVAFGAIKQYNNTKENIKLNVGTTSMNVDVILDFNKVNHLLVAGTTGSGKSVFINTVLCALISSTPLQDYELKLIDPKRVSFNQYKNLPNTKLITEIEDAATELKNLVDVMEERYSCMEREMKTDKNIFKPIFVVVDELAELMLVDRGGCEVNLIRLLQKARQANIHIILATQRPTTDVISGLIKAQCDTRVCLKMASYKDSMTVIDKGIGQKLMGHGDGFIKLPFEIDEKRFQTAYISDEEMNLIINRLLKNHIKQNVTAVVAREAIISHAEKINIENDHVKSIVKTCMENVKKWGIEIKKDIQWQEGFSREWLGLTKQDSSIIILHKNLYTQCDSVIKIVVYHELCHMAAGPDTGHGSTWRNLTKIITDNTGYCFKEKVFVDVKKLFTKGGNEC